MRYLLVSKYGYKKKREIASILLTRAWPVSCIGTFFFYPKYWVRKGYIWPRRFYYKKFYWLQFSWFAFDGWKNSKLKNEIRAKTVNNLKAAYAEVNNQPILWMNNCYSACLNVVVSNSSENGTWKKQDWRFPEISGTSLKHDELLDWTVHVMACVHGSQTILDQLQAESCGFEKNAPVLTDIVRILPLRTTLNANFFLLKLQQSVLSSSAAFPWLN